MQDRQNRAIGRGIEKFVRMPRGCERPRFGLAVPDHAGHQQHRVVKNRAERMTQRVSEFAAFMDRTGALRRSMTRNSAGKRELGKQTFQSGLVLTDVRVDFAVGAFQIGAADHRRTAVPGTGYVDHVEIVLVDDPVQMRVDEILARCRAPVSEQHALDVPGRQRLLEQRIVAKIDLPHREIIGRAPVRVQLSQMLVVYRRRRKGVIPRHGGISHHGSFPFTFKPSAPMVNPAITDSSSVRMTRTVTRPASLEITGALRAFRSSRSSMPRNWSPSQIRARMGAAFSPIPPAKTSVSKPPRAAAYAPIHFFAW